MVFSSKDSGPRLPLSGMALRVLVRSSLTCWVFFWGKLVGDNPEMCPLDMHILADGMRASHLHCALTSRLPYDDPRKFQLGTPAQAQSALDRAMTLLPPKRIITANGLARSGAIGRPLA